MERPVAYDAALVVLVALTKVCARDPKAGRKARRRAIKEMDGIPALPAVRAEAIRGIRRSCDACPAHCKGA